jgi:threonine/homoserine/homoserine lactone efflux protein
MTDQFLAYAAYAIALGIAAVIPGPGIAALVGQSLRTAWRGGLVFLIGLIIGDIIWLTIAILGLAALANALGWLFIAVKIFGGLYLIYLGWKFWKAKDTGFSDHGSTGTGSAILTGLLVTLGNPKTIVFYMALLPNVIDLGAVSLENYAVMVFITALVLIVTLVPYVALASKMRRVLSTPTSIRRLNKSAAAIISAAGAFILADARPKGL